MVAGAKRGLKGLVCSMRGGAGLPRMLLPTATLLCLALAGLAVYWPVLDDFFVLDDFIWLQAASNPSADDFFRDAFSFPTGTLFDAPTPFWRPLVDTYFYVTWRIFGDEPLPYHLLNLAIHVAVAGLTGLLARTLMKSALVGVATALVFLTLPAYDFAVTWISSVTELLAAMLYMLAVVLYATSRRTADRRLYVAALGAFGLALLTKESAVTIPVALLIVALATNFSEKEKALVGLGRDLAPFGLLALAYFAFLFSEEYGPSADEGLYRFGWHVFDNLWDYLKALTLPVSPDRGVWVETLRPFTAAGFLVICVLMAIRRDAIASALAVWVFVALLPYSFFSVGIGARYIYLASIPFSMLVVYIGWLVTRSLDAMIGRRSTTIAVILLAAVVVLSAVETRHRQDLISGQAEVYRQLYQEVPTLCGELPPRATIYVLNPPHLDPSRVSSPMALNLEYDDVFVGLQRDGTLPALAGFVQDRCVVRYVDGRYVLE